MRVSPRRTARPAICARVVASAARVASTAARALSSSLWAMRPSGRSWAARSALS